MAEEKDRKKMLETVKNLIQRTQDKVPRPEAESAAHRACVLIRKFGLEVIDPDEIDDLYRENEELKQKVLQLEAGLSDEDLVTITRAAQSLGAQMAQQANAAFVQGKPSVPFSVPSPAATAPSGFTAPPPPMSHPVRLQSKYRGHCKYCSRTYNPGDMILWQRNVGTWCDDVARDCYDQWTTNAASLQAFGAALFGQQP